MTTSSPWLGREGQDWTLTDITARRFGICRDRAESYEYVTTNYELHTHQDETSENPGEGGRIAVAGDLVITNKKNGRRILTSRQQ